MRCLAKCPGHPDTDIIKSQRQSLFDESGRNVWDCFWRWLVVLVVVGYWGLARFSVPEDWRVVVVVFFLGVNFLTCLTHCINSPCQLHPISDILITEMEG